MWRVPHCLVFYCCSKHNPQANTPESRKHYKPDGFINAVSVFPCLDNPDDGIHVKQKADDGQGNHE
jgi:hypothetical protein